MSSVEWTCCVVSGIVVLRREIMREIMEGGSQGDCNVCHNHAQLHDGG